MSSRANTLSSWLWTASLVSYGLADSLILISLVRNEFAWEAFGWFLACVLATAVGSMMALGWFFRSLFQRLRAAETSDCWWKGWTARAIAIVCLGIPCVFICTYLAVLLAEPINPTH